ncbi:hypothetical protein WN55_10306 [Dufourea novaeangliae]|uniref:Uncharacterized protein n=1 Tax=Dufourea novaeangliae TaxID=178035 RepID=A0A154P398_DUFNO|nr:hypothetical protein WN55_10306 [Dufourea novaeangliae]
MHNSKVKLLEALFLLMEPYRALGITKVHHGMFKYGNRKRGRNYYVSARDWLRNAYYPTCSRVSLLSFKILTGT